MRMAGKGEVGWGFLHLNYLVVVVVVGGGMCWGIWGKEGGHRVSSGWGKKLKGFYGKPRRLIWGWVQLGVGPKLPGVNDFPFNYFATCARILSPGGSWITRGLNTHALLNSNTHTNWLHSSLWYSGMISPEFLWHRDDDSNVSTLPLTYTHNSSWEEFLFSWWRRKSLRFSTQHPPISVLMHSCTFMRRLWAFVWVVI